MFPRPYAISGCGAPWPVDAPSDQCSVDAKSTCFFFKANNFRSTRLLRHLAVAEGSLPMQRCDFGCAIINKTEHITLLVKTWVMNMAILCCQQHTAFPIPLARSSSLVGHGGLVFAIVHSQT